MTSRERLVAAARGGQVDPKPVIVWGEPSERSDAVVVKPNEVERALAESPDRAILAEVLSPFGRAVEFQLPLSTMLRETPEQGAVELDRLCQVCRDDIETAILAGADGILYRIQGAIPAHSTPMEYGGFYLDRDRELLESVSEARLNVVYVEGGPEPYLDFVSDLPAHLFAWDEGEVALVRKMRSGALAFAGEGGDVLFVGSSNQIAESWRLEDGLASA